MYNKKKLLSVIAVVAIVVVMALNINFSAKKYSLSDLALANVEALAKPEDPEDPEDYKCVSYFDRYLHTDGCTYSGCFSSDGKRHLFEPAISCYAMP